MRNPLTTRDSMLGAWSPLRGFADLQRDLDRLFEDLVSPASSGGKSWSDSSFVPRAEVHEDEGHYLMSFDLPGIKRDDIRIDVVDGQLTVSGERRHETESRKEGRFFTEREYGRFQRAFTLPPGVNADKVEASYEDGVLRIAVPKAESARPKQIPIQDSKSGVFGRLLGKEKEKKQTPAA